MVHGRQFQAQGVHRVVKTSQMNILILSGSPRKGGNTELLARSFVEGAGKSNEVELFSVEDYKVQPCIGCNS